MGASPLGVNGCSRKSLGLMVLVGDLFSNAMNQEQGNIKC
jgi:hypothetical protein